MEDELPFEVPWHRFMVMCVAGKLPETVLTIERQIFTWRICEYSEPTAYDRFWCYETLLEAENAFTAYLMTPAGEPSGYIRRGELIFKREPRQD